MSLVLCLLLKPKRVLLENILQKSTLEKSLSSGIRKKPVYQRAVKALTKELYSVSAKLLPGKAGRLSAEWQLIRRNNPDFLVVLGNYTDVMNFLKFSPQINIPMLTGHALADSQLPEWLGQKVSERVRVLTAYPLKIETEHPGQILHNLILREYAPKPGSQPLDSLWPCSCRING